MVILAADLLLVSRPLASQVETLARRDAPGLPPLFFTATHTHSGPGAWGSQWLEEKVAGEFDARVRDSLAEDLAAAAVAAWTTLQPCDLGWVRTDVPEGVTNRTVPGGPVDPTLEALVLRRSSDRMLAVLALYGAHATCLGLPMEISAMLSSELRTTAARHGWTLALSCFPGDYVGYVVPDKVYADGTLYESRLNFLGPQGGSFTTRLIEAITRGTAP